MILKFSSLSIPEMRLIANIIAAKLRQCDIVTLSGEVGAGKTTFARSLIQALATEIVEVTSPTFTLMQSYDIKLADGIYDTLWHLDLYRLESGREAENLGLEELWQHITVIEWPAIIKQSLPEHHLDISFDFGDNYDTRNIIITGNEAWYERLKDIK